MAAAAEGISMAKAGDMALLKLLLRRLDFIVWVGIGAAALAAIYYWLLLQVSTLETVIANFSQEPVYFIAVSVLMPLTLLLFGLNTGLAVLLFQASGRLNWSAGSLIGALVGGFGAACPLCGAFLLSLLGVTAGLAALPFAGLEFWGIATVMMGLAFQASMKRLTQSTCIIDSSTAPCWQLPNTSTRYLIMSSVILVTLLGSIVWMATQNEAGLL
jgi:hypothetical protein